MATARQRLGRWGEEAAARYLQAQGYEIIARNLRTEYGELDLIARKDGKLIFVEVKARRSVRFGHPEESVTPAKQEHLIAAAQTYLLTQPADTEWRVDVIAVRQHRGAPPEVVHFENALSG